MSFWLCRINFNETQLHQDKLWVYLSGFQNVGVANTFLGETKADSSNDRARVWDCDPPLVYTCSLLLPSLFFSLNVDQGLSCSSVGKESACNAGDLGSIPGSGRSPGEGNGNPLQYSCLENPMDRRAWQATVHSVARVRHDWATNHTPTQCSPEWVLGKICFLPTALSTIRVINWCSLLLAEL